MNGMQIGGEDCAACLEFQSSYLDIQMVKYIVGIKKVGRTDGLRVLLSFGIWLGHAFR